MKVIDIKKELYLIYNVLFANDFFILIRQEHLDNKVNHLKTKLSFIAKLVVNC